MASKVFVSEILSFNLPPVLMIKSPLAPLAKQRDDAPFGASFLNIFILSDSTILSYSYTIGEIEYLVAFKYFA